MILAFNYNPTSWRSGAPIPGGMADCLIQPILPHILSEYVTDNMPGPDRVNTYYTFRSTYGLDVPPDGEVSVFISHGIADKAWRNARKVKSFDWVFVSGPAWTERMVKGGVPKDRVLEVGYAKLDPIFNDEIPDTWMARDGRIRVVHAPTHGGGGEQRQTKADPRGWSRSSHWRTDEITALLDPEHFDVRVAPHPRHRRDKRSTLAEYVGADVVIADGGSTIYEAWALDLPVVFPSWITSKANRRRATDEGRIYSRRLGYHAHTADQLAERVTAAFQAGIRDVDRAFIADRFPVEYRGDSGRRHAEALDMIVKEAA